MARQRGFEIVHEYSDVISGAKSKRPGLDQLMADARRRRFDIVLVAAFDRVAWGLLIPSLLLAIVVMGFRTRTFGLTRMTNPPQTASLTRFKWQHEIAR